MPSEPREHYVEYEPRRPRDPSEPREHYVVRKPGGIRDCLTALDGHDHDPHDAHAYRLMQAEELLREMGYVPQDNGTWKLPDE